MSVTADATWADGLMAQATGWVGSLGIIRGQPSQADVLLAAVGALVAVWIGVVIATRIFSPASSLQSLGTSLLWCALSLGAESVAVQLQAQSPNIGLVATGAALVGMCVGAKLILSTSLGRAAGVVSAGLVFAGIAGVLLTYGLRLVTAI